MNSNQIVTEMGLDLQRVTVEAINAYCRVLELHVKTVEQAGLGQKTPPHVGMATEGLAKELQFLNFLRHGEGEMGAGKDSPEEP